LIPALFSTLQAASAAPDQPQVNAPLTLLILIVAVMAWFGLRSFVRSLRAGKAQAAVKGDFNAFALEALVNAAKIDGRVDARERDAVTASLRELGATLDAAALDGAFASARLGKGELIAYLRARSGAFTRDQKIWLLKALLAVFVADGTFDESEHAALVDYTAAIGFDRQSAPDMLRNLSHQFMRGSIT
jgi:tellurite resistance protein